MSDFIEIFNPGMRFWRQQKDFEKIQVVDEDQGGPGPKPLDLDSGHVNVVLRPPTAVEDVSAEEVEGEAKDDGGDTDRQEGR